MAQGHGPLRTAMAPEARESSDGRGENILAFQHHQLVDRVSNHTERED